MSSMNWEKLEYLAKRAGAVGLGGALVAASLAAHAGDKCGGLPGGNCDIPKVSALAVSSSAATDASDRAYAEDTVSDKVYPVLLEQPGHLVRARPTDVSSGSVISVIGERPAG